MRLAAVLRIGVVAVVLAASSAVIVPAIAAAAPYTAAVCDVWNGNVNSGAFGWSANYGTIDSAQNCDGIGAGEGLQAWSVGATQGGRGGGWWFKAPAGTTITHLDYSGAFSAWDGWVANLAT
ncbi:MAG: hypothetical protein ABSG43_24320, partial [Solirubrobacteraceae bacterium]